ncbi:ABC transporter permease [Alkalibacillus sp. S2W]|uniref:ABC transporter permease n=1 Tax=Alkalibacillus sp. S2W TaxID=3386553 RepID=UPI00398CF14C
MILAWKEIKNNKAKFSIVGSIILLISLLTFIISGLANGLSQDNMSLIKNFPDGTFYMAEDSNNSYAQSRIDEKKQMQLLENGGDSFAFSLQMGNLKIDSNKQKNVSLMTYTDNKYYQNIDNGEIVLDHSLKKEGIKAGDQLSFRQSENSFEVAGFVDDARFNHSPVVLINQNDFNNLFRTQAFQIVFSPISNKDIDGLNAYSNSEFLNTIPSYQAEQMTLNMIVWFLIIISGMLFAIFFYMMNVQKLGMYGILKALGIRTNTLYTMIWTQMGIITVSALISSALLSQVFQSIAPTSMPYSLPLTSTIQLSILFIVVGFMGATLSGIQIKRIDPLQAIQQGEA